MVQWNTVLLLGVLLLLLYLATSSGPQKEHEVQSGAANLVDRAGSDWNRSGSPAEGGLRQTARGPILLNRPSGTVESRETVSPWTVGEPLDPANQRTTIYTDVNVPIEYFEGYSGALRFPGQNSGAGQNSDRKDQVGPFGSPDGSLEPFGSQSSTLEAFHNPNEHPSHSTESGPDLSSRSGPGSKFRDSYGQYKAQDELYPNYYNKYEVFTSDYYPWWRNQHFWPYYTRSHNWMYRYPYYSYWRRPYYYNYWASPYYPSRTVLVKPYLKELNRKTELRRDIADSFRTSKINDSTVST